MNQPTNSHGVNSPHEARRCAIARAAFLQVRGCDFERAAQIATLPTVEWKGKTLRTLRCHGTSGKGPHDCNVPESLLWSLISLQRFFCVYHAGDAFSSSLKWSKR